MLQWTLKFAKIGYSTLVLSDTFSKHLNKGPRGQRSSDNSILNPF